MQRAFGGIKPLRAREAREQLRVAFHPRQSSDRSIERPNPSLQELAEQAESKPSELQPLPSDFQTRSRLRPPPLCFLCDLL